MGHFVATWAMTPIQHLPKRWLPSAVLMLVASALAHQPLFNDGAATQAQAYRITEPTVSKVITSEGQGGRNWHALDVSNNFQLDVTLFVGASCDRAFSPQLYLVGAGLAGKAPFELPNGMGALAVANSWSDYSGHGVVARKGQELLRKLSAGRYYLVVEHGSSGGWYFLSLGGSEVGGGSSAGRSALARFNRCQ
jgi:hypothetical protein